MTKKELKALRKSGLETKWSHAKKSILDQSVADAERLAYWPVMCDNQALMKAVYCREIQLVFQEIGKYDFIFESPPYNEAKARLYLIFPPDPIK